LQKKKNKSELRKKAIRNEAKGWKSRWSCDTHSLTHGTSNLFPRVLLELKGEGAI
jgi:hypothetical protein